MRFFSLMQTATKMLLFAVGHCVGHWSGTGRALQTPIGWATWLNECTQASRQKPSGQVSGREGCWTFWGNCVARRREPGYRGWTKNSDQLETSPVLSLPYPRNHHSPHPPKSMLKETPNIVCSGRHRSNFEAGDSNIDSGGAGGRDRGREGDTPNISPMVNRLALEVV